MLCTKTTLPQKMERAMVANSLSASPFMDSSNLSRPCSSRRPARPKLLVAASQNAQEDVVVAEAPSFPPRLLISSALDTQRAFMGEALLTPDHYGMLGLTPSSSHEEINDCYPVFKHKFSDRVLWLNNWHTSDWVKEPLKKEEVKVTAAALKTSSIRNEQLDEEEDEEEYEWPRLICCFGEAMNDFVPTVRVSWKRQDPDIYSTWKMLQWKPPEFARILGGPSYNTAIALARQGCRVALMGKVGDDKYGRELVHTLNINEVQTRGVRFDRKVRTGISQLNISYEDGKARMSCVQPSAENALMESEINVDILKEALIFHFTSSILTTEPIRSSLFTALRIFKSYKGDVFFDVNLPLPLWISREHTWSVIKEAWLQANFIEVTKHELEFLVGEENVRRRPPQYAANNEKEMQPLRDEYHYKKSDLASVWHDNLKMLIVTDGTYVIHYYTPEFDGEVLGVEDVIVAAYTCDRAGSADAIVAGVIRKLNLHPEIWKDEVTLPKALRYAMSAGVIAQWSPGSTKGLPTESAIQNLTEQLYHPVFVQSIGTELYATRTEQYLL